MRVTESVQGSSLCTLTLAPIEVRYRFDTAAELTLLLDEFLISEALTGYREHNTSVTTLRTCVLQRMRDSGSLKAQTATMAIDHASPVTIDCGAVSVLIPASRPKPGAIACTHWQQPIPIVSVHDVVNLGTIITLVACSCQTVEVSYLLCSWCRYGERAASRGQLLCPWAPAGLVRVSH